MVAELTERVGLEPLLSEDPQLIGALGVALFVEERCRGGGQQEAVKVHYGYSDGTGNYFITVDAGRCDGCGECVSVCPSLIFKVVQEDGAQPKVRVQESARKKLALLCPGYTSCRSTQESNCHSTCPKDAISHTW
jgi:ferredoxin